MRLATRLCFLVLAVSSASRGQNQTATSELQTKNSTVPCHTDSSQPTPTTLLPSSDAPTTDTVPTPTANRVESNSTLSQTQATTRIQVSTTEEVNSSSGFWVTQTTTLPGSPVSIATTGYVILVLIVLAIIFLCGIIFFLRRASRTYSFDLQRPPPSSHLNEPIGTFEPMCLDDLDQVVYVDQVTPDGFSRSSCANGTAPRSDKKAPDDQTDTTRGAADASPQEEPGANAQDASSTSSTSGSVSEDPVDKTASLSNGIDLLMDSTGEEEQNQANSPTVCPTDTFFDVNLEVVAQSEPSESPGENP
ncbi:mucin-2 isoform X1 [Takifugu flavidus]|uniref:mucin-2 isoform X1 n=1 Tax=Takifugu flavidus TaxID=433684 RepID=UPI002544B7C7|nr:mucin-2 isoform X1 [Takifugu flavidus]